MRKLTEGLDGLPMQPVILDDDGRGRFRENAVVRHLLDEATAGRRCSMNELAIAYHEKKFSVAEMNQFAMLIGYTVDGFCELSYAFYAIGDLAMLETCALRDSTIPHTNMTTDTAED